MLYYYRIYDEVNMIESNNIRKENFEQPKVMEKLQLL